MVRAHAIRRRGRLVRHASQGGEPHSKRGGVLSVVVAEVAEERVLVVVKRPLVLCIDLRLGNKLGKR